MWRMTGRPSGSTRMRSKWTAASASWSAASAFRRSASAAPAASSPFALKSIRASFTTPRPRARSPRVAGQIGSAAAISRPKLPPTTRPRAANESTIGGPESDSMRTRPAVDSPTSR